ncbi:MAG TPA: SDR family oxidoreductase [Mycobacteriales bacterium]|nr:SDR family oxidoreductase [Mycobacteriales bacterium]
MAETAWSVGAGLEERVVVVTGAAGGIGAATVAALVRTGARVVALDVVAPAASDANLALTADLTDLPGHAALLDAIEEIGPVYGLIHCAGVLRRRSQVTDITEEDWDAQVDLNLKGTFFFIRDAAERMKKNGAGGRIVTFTSQGWWTGGFGGSVVYAATKGGIVSMSRGLARTLGPHGITVNSIAPGQARTRMLLDDLDENVMNSMTEQTPLGRIAEPSEVAGVAVFLASRHASFITGATINVSGGFLMY